MIDPTKFPRYGLSVVELEEVALFCIAVAGKKAKTIARALDQFLVMEGWDTNNSPFELIRRYKDYGPAGIADSLKAAGIGCYTTKSIAMYGLANSSFDLKTCTVQDLESVYGIGPKTARFFILHTRLDAEVACLDTHILKYLGTLGYQVPKQTPAGKKYIELERVYLDHAKQLGRTPADLDIEIWKQYSGNM